MKLKLNRFVSGLLALLMVISMLTIFSTTVFAAEDKDTESSKDNTSETTAGDDGENVDGEETDGGNAESESTVNYYSESFVDPQSKVATMQLMLTSDDGRYELYVQTVTGEIAYKDTKTGQILFSNPYDIATTNPGADASIKEQMMSQIVLNFSQQTYNSYTWCILKDQLSIKYIDGGIRLEYAIGRLDARRLLPRIIKKERFDTLIRPAFPSNDIPDDELSNEDYIARQRINAFYILKDPSDPSLSTRNLKQMQSDFKITKKMAVYVFDPTSEDAEKNFVESLIKKYCTSASGYPYTYEDLEEDHDITEYTGTETAPPIFHMALEYSLDDTGLKVRCPVGGLRYVESDYSLESVRVLPYFGAGAYDGQDLEGVYDGYGFLPDGSGTLVQFKDFDDNLSRTVTQVVYGQDFSYYTLSYEHQEVVRLPVYGMVTSVDWQVDTPDSSGQTAWKEDKGYLAIIEKGAEMSEISSYTGGSLSLYDTVYSTLKIRANDSYDISEAITAADSAMVATTSAKKFTGDYTLEYIMLNGDDEAASAGLSEGDYYKTSYVGMAKAYQDYLVKNGELGDRLTKEDVTDDIPLYLEAFGTIEAKDTFLSFPITVHTPLTTFDDLKTMLSTLKDEGVSNVDLKLTGFFNGGLTSSAPNKAKVEKNVGGSSGLKDFLNYASENSYDVFPEFDFVFVNAQKNNIFNGFNKKKYLARATDGNRYASKHEYSAQSQTFKQTSFLVLSPYYYTTFFDKLTSKLDEYDFQNISVSTLGSYLNGDYNKDEEAETFMRNETLTFYQDLFKAMKEKYARVMTDSGNAYSLVYSTDILNVPLDSSSFNYTSDTVPFMGMVLHGYVNIAGPALNTVGDIPYEILRSIENGAYPYFILSYENTEDLKKDETYSKYYSINFDIWKNDVVKYYNQLNEALRDVQTSCIVDHEFLTGTRDYPEAEMQEIQAALALLQQKFPVGTPQYKTQKALIDSKYIVDNNRIVKVTYENGVVFYLNYNNYAVTVNDNGTEIKLGAEGYQRVDA